MSRILCDIPGCNQPAHNRQQIVIYPSQPGAASVAVIAGLVCCDTCKEKAPLPHNMGEGAWRRIESELMRLGKPSPAREKTRIIWKDL